eukprot:660292-Pyramimonas_sp.AAC.1
MKRRMDSAGSATHKPARAFREEGGDRMWGCREGTRAMGVVGPDIHLPPRRMHDWAIFVAAAMPLTVSPEPLSRPQIRSKGS